MSIQTDAAVKRLASIISDKGESRKRHAELHFGLAEGWFSLVLLALVVYSTIWSVQAVKWVDHLDMLNLTAALGLIGGVVVAKQRWIPHFTIHLVVIVCGLLLASWQTAAAFYQGHSVVFFDHSYRWLSTVLSGGNADDNPTFFFFITVFSFFLAYSSAWFVYHTRRPWLTIVANAVVLLINLNSLPTSSITILFVFLFASLLLLMRLNLYESMRGWQRQGLRYPDGLGWRVMQAGTLISIGLLIFSWLLPAGYANEVAARVWNGVEVQDMFNGLTSVTGGNPSNHGEFGNALALGGNPNLNNKEVFTVQSAEGSPYLAAVSYDTYTGREWVNGPTAGPLALQPRQTFSSGAALRHHVQQIITVVNPPGEQKTYLFGASDMAEVDLPASVLRSSVNGTVIAWLARQNLTVGMHYTVISDVSSADEQTLRTVPMPTDSPNSYDPLTAYGPAVVRTYTQLPSNLDPTIAQIALKITASAPTMYDKVVALEQYLHSHYQYSLDIQPPRGEEPTSWFLFRSGNKGFCTYFATAMAVMARSLGIPARVVAGYTNGTYDDKTRNRVIRGGDAHSWVQVYFAGYGWIDFEPTTNSPLFTRPLANQSPSSPDLGSASGTHLKNPGRGGAADLPSAGGTDTARATQQAQLRQQLGMAFGSIVLLLLFGCLLFVLWWRKLFSKYSLATQIYGRMCLLARWAGIEVQPWQTPYESIQRMTTAIPLEAGAIERLGDIYVRTHWADPQSMQHPHRSGEVSELPVLWKHLQPRLFLYALRHPRFLRRLPQRLKTFRG